MLNDLPINLISYKPALNNILCKKHYHRDDLSGIFISLKWISQKVSDFLLSVFVLFREYITKICKANFSTFDYVVECVCKCKYGNILSYIHYLS